MPLPDLTSYPVWAQLVFVAAVAAVYAMVHLGIAQGRKSTPAGQGGTKQIELAGAVIDNVRADAVVAALDRNTKAIAGATSAVNQARDDIRDLTLELVRKGK